MRIIFAIIMSDPSSPRVLASTDSYLGLVAALRERGAWLKLPSERAGVLGGLCDGHAEKLLRSEPKKYCGPMSFDAILGPLGVKIVVVDDTAKRARVPPKGQYRPRSFG